MTTSVEPAILIFLGLAFLGGAVINGLIGMGLALVAVNAIGNVLDPKVGVVVLSLIAPFLSCYQLRHNWSFVSGWRRLRSLTAWAILGSIVGAQLLVLLPTWVIALALGLFTAQFVVDRLRRSGPPSRGTPSGGWPRSPASSAAPPTARSARRARSSAPTC